MSSKQDSHLDANVTMAGKSENPSEGFALTVAAVPMVEIDNALSSTDSNLARSSPSFSNLRSGVMLTYTSRR